MCMGATHSDLVRFMGAGRRGETLLEDERCLEDEAEPEG